MSGLIYCPACNGIAAWSGTTNIGQYVGETCNCVNKLSYADLLKERCAYKKAAEILLEAMGCANNQWGDDYLWKKYKLSDDMGKAKAIIEEITKKESGGGMILNKLRKYLHDGRRYKANSYSVSANFLEDVVKHMEADEALIAELRSFLALGANNASQLIAKKSEAE
jgi:hypothetical protein